MTSYTFMNVHADHTVFATFAPTANTSATTLSVTPASAGCATPETLTVHVDGATAGSIAFLDGGALIGNTYLQNGTATFLI